MTSLYLKERGDKKDERDKFIKMDVYAKYCRYTGVRRHTAEWEVNLSNYNNMDLPHVIVPPNYSTLLHWWDAWPEARPELLDFWARGNYTRRLLSRSKTNRSGCIVRVEYVDEMEAALKKACFVRHWYWFCLVWSDHTIATNIGSPRYGIWRQWGWGYMACAGSLLLA